MRRTSDTILLAEDDDGHALLIERHLRRAGLQSRLVRARDGNDALDFVRGSGRFAAEARPPTLRVLLDISMPGIDGYGVLAALRGDRQTALVPVYVLTTTDDPREVDRCFRSGCNAFLTKPVDADDFARTMRALAEFLQATAVPRYRPLEDE